MVAQLDALLQDAVTAAIKPLRAHRNKRVAHRDLPVALAPDANLLPDLSREAIETALRAVRAFMDEAEGFLKNSTTGYYPMLDNDARGLIKALQMASAYADLKDVPEIPDPPRGRLRY